MKRSSIRVQTGFITKTLRALSNVLEYEFYSERYVQNGMLLQSIAPVIKLLVVLLFLILAAAASNVVVLITLTVIAFVYAKLSGLCMNDFLRRSWAYIPVVVLLCSLPGTSSLFLKGPPFLTVIKPGVFGLKNGLYFTSAGLKSACILALRPGVSLSFAILLLMTTRWSQITGALAQLHVPRVFVSILNMAYRYIFIIVETANSMMQARSLRTVGKLKTKDNRTFIGHSTGALFMRSFALSQSVYEAIRCRSFSGKTIVFSGSKVCFADIFFGISNLLIAGVVLMGERLF